jgi:hypothetical protein
LDHLRCFRFPAQRFGRVEVVDRVVRLLGRRVVLRVGPPPDAIGLGLPEDGMERLP